MRKKELRVIITFRHTTSAMAFENLCKESRVEGRIIPVPRCITAGCGLCWSAPPQTIQSLMDMMKQHHIDYDQIYELEI